MLFQRTVVALLLVPPVLAAAWFGGWIFAAVVAVAAGIGARELAGLFGLRRSDCRLVSVGTASLALAARFGPLGLSLALGLIVVGLLIREVAAARVEGAASRLALQSFVLIYVGWLGAHLVLLRNSFPSGIWPLLLAMVTTWGYDTGAYFIGRAWGRRRLAPRVSAGKSIEGLIGGLAVAAAVGGVLGPRVGLGWPAGIVLGALLGGAGQLGDLAESVLKRCCGAKDAGDLLPGHGGMLDRLDSLLFTGPMAFYFLWLLSVLGPLGQ